MKTMNGGAVTLLYDGDGNRVAKTVGSVTTRYLIDDLNPTGLPQVVEETVGGAVTRQYTYGLQLISENQFVSGAWTASFYETDGTGSVRQLTNSLGQVTDSYEYDAFGNKVNATGATPNNYLYRGEQFDPDLSLYYLRARYYNASTGRFLSSDPLAGEGERRYQYAAADPVNGLDPTGDAAMGEFLLINMRGFMSVSFPSLPPWCADGTGTSVGGYLPPCKHHWIVMVNWRPLYGLSEFAFGHHPLGHWHHTYISIYNPDKGTETWGVLGQNNTSKNQEVLRHDPRNNNVGGGGTEVSCSDSEAETLWDALIATDYTDSHRVCPSCKKNYHNWWWRQPPDGNNSNTYTYSMIYNWGKTPPDELNAPGYHYAPGYPGYF